MFNLTKDKFYHEIFLIFYFVVNKAFTKLKYMSYNKNKKKI